MLTLRLVLRAYLLRRIGEDAGGNKAAFARMYKIAEPDVVNAANGAAGRGVTFSMLERMARNATPPRRLSTMLQEMAGIAMELESLVNTRTSTTRPELLAILRVVNEAERRAKPQPAGGDAAPAEY